jgi:ketosteroid isomerase-like protein
MFRNTRTGKSRAEDRRVKATPIAAAAIAAAVLAGPASALAQEEVQPFVDALEAHLDAVVTHDMEALLPTLTSGEELTMITPDGTRLTTKQQYIDFHRQWFAADDDQEELDFEIVSVVESSELSHALMRIRYLYTGPAGDQQSYTGWLTLTFALEDGRWALVFDQNTGIGEQPEARRR